MQVLSQVEGSVATALAMLAISGRSSTTSLHHLDSTQFIRPSDVTALALHTCGPLSAGITGACLSIDGGWVAG